MVNRDFLDSLQSLRERDNMALNRKYKPLVEVKVPFWKLCTCVGPREVDNPRRAEREARV